MRPSPRRRFGAPRRREPIGSFGFLRPPRRHEEEQRLFLERLRTEPALRREYRASLILQLCVVGALLVACLVLVVQSAVLLRHLQSPSLAALGWFIPGAAGILALLVLRRFMRLVRDWRELRQE